MVSEVGTALDPGVVARRSVTAAQNLSGSQKTTAESEREFRLFGKDGFSFWDFLDIVNPLQHIPVVGTIYRAVTGDQLDPGAKMFGGALFGGPIGAALSAADVAVKHNTGKDIGEHAIALLDDDETPEPGIPPAVQAASAATVLPSVPAIAPSALAPTPRQLDPAFETTSALPRPQPAAGMGAVPEARTSPFAWADGNRALDEFYRNRQAKSVAEPAPDLGILADAGIVRRSASSVQPSNLAPDPMPSTNQQLEAGTGPTADSTADALRRLAQDLRAAKATPPATGRDAGITQPQVTAPLLPSSPVTFETTSASLTSTNASNNAALPGKPQLSGDSPPADGWVFQAMVRALEKYEATGTLPQANRSAGVSVVR